MENSFSRFRKSVILPCCLAGLVLAASTGVSARTGDELSREFYENALIRYEQGEYEGAIVELKNAIQQSPRNPAARLLMGQTYLKLGNGAAAQMELIRARQNGAHEDYVLIPLAEAFFMQRKYDEIIEQIRPGHRDNDIEADIGLIRGRAYLAIRNLDEADKSLAAAARRRPDHGPTLVEQAKVRLARGSLDDAELFADDAIKHDPKNPEAWFVKAEARRTRLDYTTAIEYYSKAIELGPDDIAARLARAGTLVDLRRDDEALVDVLVVREKLPLEPRAAYLHALILTRADKIDEAQAVLTEAAHVLKNQPPEFVRNHAPSLLLLGVISYAQKDYDESYAYLSRFLEFAPHHPGARKLLGAILLRGGKYKAAIDMLRPALRYLTEDPELFALLGNSFMRLKMYSEAATMLEKAASYAPDRARIRTLLAMSRMATGEDLKALEDFEAAFALKPDGSRPGVLLATIHIRRKRYDEALRIARVMINRDAKNPVGPNIMGAAYLGKGERAKAREGFETALKIDSAFLPARFNLAKMDRQDKRIDAAKNQYLKILEQETDNVEAMDHLARIAEAERRLEDAAVFLEKITSLHPDAVTFGARLADIYLRQHRLDAALNLAHNLETLHPASLVALETYGRVLLKMAKPTEAQKKFRRMVPLVATSPEGLRRVSHLQHGAGDIQGARESLNKAIALDKDYLPARIALIRLEAGEMKLATAFSLADALRKSHPNSGAGDVITGELLMRAHRYKEAVAAYEAGFAKNRTGEIVRLIYTAKAMAGSGEEGLRTIEDWVAANPNDALTKRFLASAYLRAGRLKDAVAQNERLLVEFPDDARLLNNLAGQYQLLGDSRARSFAEKAYKLAPDHAATLDTYGWILVQMGEPERGLKLLRQARTRARHNPDVRYHLGVALSRLGRLREAKQEIREALKMNRKFTGAEKARELLKQLSGG